MATNLMSSAVGPVSLASRPSREQKKAKKFIRGLCSISDLTPSLAKLRVALEASVAALPMEGKGGEIRAILSGSFADVLEMFYEEVKREKAGVKGGVGDVPVVGSTNESKSGRKGKEMETLPITPDLYDLVPPGTLNAHVSPFASLSHFPSTISASEVFKRLGTPGVFSSSEIQWEAVDRVVKEEDGDFEAIKKTTQLCYMRFGPNGCGNEVFGRLIGAYLVGGKVTKAPYAVAVLGIVLDAFDEDHEADRKLKFTVSVLEFVVSKLGASSLSDDFEVNDVLQRIMLKGGASDLDIMVDGGMDEVTKWCEKMRKLEMMVEEEERRKRMEEDREGEGGGEEEDDSDEEESDDSDDSDNSEEEEEGEEEASDDSDDEEDENDDDAMFTIDTAGAADPEPEQQEEGGGAGDDEEEPEQLLEEETKPSTPPTKTPSTRRKSTRKRTLSTDVSVASEESRPRRSTRKR